MSNIAFYYPGQSSPRTPDPRPSGKVLTHWLSPVDPDPPRSIQEAIQRVERLTPEGWTPRILIPAVYGFRWQGFIERPWRTLPDELAPRYAGDLVQLREIFTTAGILFGAWSVPRTLTATEGRTHREAAEASGCFVFDVEPYSGFLLYPDRDPSEFLEAYRAENLVPTGVSLIPRESDLRSHGDALPTWIRDMESVRPQSYFTDDPRGLAYPESAEYMRGAIAGLGLQVPVVPIIPCVAVGGDQTRAILAEAESDLDLWRLV